MGAVHSEARVSGLGELGWQLGAGVAGRAGPDLAWFRPFRPGLQGPGSQGWGGQAWGDRVIGSWERTGGSGPWPGPLGSLAHAPKSVVHSPWSIFHGPWSIVHNPQTIVHNPWHIVHGP